MSFQERLQLVCESETLRIYTRSALAEKNQSCNLSVCQILAEDDFYNMTADASAAAGNVCFLFVCKIDYQRFDLVLPGLLF